MELSKLLYTAIVFTAVGVISTVLIFFAKGYQLSTEEKAVEKTGWILVKSAPDGAKVLIDNERADNTNASIGGLDAGTYTIQIIKEGYHEWKKNVLVKEEFVTLIDALLIRRAAEIKPVTFTGISNPVVNDSQTQVAYFSAGEEKEGLWVYTLTQTPFLPAPRSNPKLIAQGSEFRNLSSIDWAPNSAELIATYPAGPEQEKRSILLSLEHSNNRPYSFIEREKIVDDWQQERTRIREEIVAGLDVPEEHTNTALDLDTKFSQDGEKFLYTTDTENYTEYHVYNLSNPLPIGTKRDTTVLQVGSDEDIEVLWHSTSEHLIIMDENTISIIEIDGLNKTDIFSTELAHDLALPTPGGRNIIISTSFTKDALPNLHNIYFN